MSLPLKVSRVNIFFSQIGSNWALTAAHCVYDNDLEENFPANSLTVVFGVHNRTKLTARTRWNKSKEKSWVFAICRVVPVAELVVHPEHNITRQIHDIALLKLGLCFFLYVWPIFRGKSGPDKLSSCVSSLPWTKFWWLSWPCLWSLLLFLDWGSVYISVVLIQFRLGWNKWRTQLWHPARSSGLFKF